VTAPNQPKTETKSDPEGSVAARIPIPNSAKGGIHSAQPLHNKQ
jgi:hypothetical protein